MQSALIISPTWKEVLVAKWWLQSFGTLISYKLDCLKKCDHQNGLKVPGDVLVSMQNSLSVESTISFTLKTVSKCVITTEALAHMLFLLSKKYYFPKNCLKLCDCLESFKSKIRGGFVATKIWQSIGSVISIKKDCLKSLIITKNLSHR